MNVGWNSHSGVNGWQLILYPDRIWIKGERRADGKEENLSKVKENDSGRGGGESGNLQRLFTFPTILPRLVVSRTQVRIWFLYTSLVPSHPLTHLTLTTTLRSRQERDYCPLLQVRKLRQRCEVVCPRAFVQQTFVDTWSGAGPGSQLNEAEPRSPDGSQEPGPPKNPAPCWWRSCACLPGPTRQEIVN